MNSFNSGKGKEFEQGKLNLNDLYEISIKFWRIKFKERETRDVRKHY